MSGLADIAVAIRDCIATAWIDARTGDVVESLVVRPGTDVGPALDAAAEVMRLRERPPRMVLLSASHVHIIQRVARNQHLVLVVICLRSPNLGLGIALVRAFADAESA